MIPRSSGRCPGAGALIAAAYDDPHEIAAEQWEAYAALLPPSPTVAQVATGSRWASYSPPMPGGDYGLAIGHAAWHRSFLGTLGSVPLLVRGCFIAGPCRTRKRRDGTRAARSAVKSAVNFRSLLRVVFWRASDTLEAHMPLVRPCRRCPWCASYADKSGWCDAHRKQAFAGSAPMPPGWSALRLACLERDGWICAELRRPGDRR